ncbi:response regulator transcription factor [Companilactobacillus ginsenosidimutans]|uniref:Transcriptional regulator n=1 Tax=Companilactobacillus ginsenosidimutans TaxID=1007676 RepID=A0A0H4QM17_9LACO|nr:response regulator transcription factor [Companilactobacillus ginsenosidimutans]AKP67753.1 transcriptional regulator [Companilactobacillus ginsenosidimutans]
MTEVYLAEDQEMLNTALSTLLNLKDDIDVIGSATDGMTAFKEIVNLKPEVVILDIEMPQLTGLDVAKEIRALKLPIKIIILTTFAQEDYFERAVKYDVNAYQLKDSPTDQLIDTIHQVLNGKTIFSPELVKTVIRAEKNPLTTREMDVLKEISTGASSKEIASKIYLSEGTVRNYISSILSKTDSKSRIEALNVAKHNKWI